tara:strand:+ start:898 stop:2127 length:1230 start_codon:yes stop_codon:yes gene_type:complete
VKSNCRISGKDDLISVCDLGTHASAGYFPKSKSEELSFGSLNLGWSPSSGLLQLLEKQNIPEMYGDNYGYRSGLNSSMVNHLEKKVKLLTSIVPKKKLKYVLDIGSNDGTLLSFYSSDIARIGIDPTAKKFQKYYKEGIIAISDFFDAEKYLKISGKNKASIITSISMFYDLEDPGEFVYNISECLDEDGIWNFEQSYMPSMLKKTSYDTICHEHIEYYSLKVVKELLEKYNLRILDVTFNNTNGGSFSVIACHEKSNYKSNKSLIDWILYQEFKQEIHTIKPYKEFEKKSLAHKDNLKYLLGLLNKDGKKVAGYGASTKGNVILQFCNISQKDIFAIAEVNEEKFGKYTPVSNIPIMSEESVKAEMPDYMLVLPWHFRENIIKREQEFISKGGKLIFPLPEIEIVADE